MRQRTISVSGKGYAILSVLPRSSRGDWSCGARNPRKDEICRNGKLESSPSRKQQPRRRKGKSMRGPRHQTPRQGKNPGPPANLVAVFEDATDAICRTIASWCRTPTFTREGTCPDCITGPSGRIVSLKRMTSFTFGEFRRTGASPREKFPPAIYSFIPLYSSVNTVGSFSRLKYCS